MITAVAFLLLYGTFYQLTCRTHKSICIPSSFLLSLSALLAANIVSLYLQTDPLYLLLPAPLILLSPFLARRLDASSNCLNLAKIFKSAFQIAKDHLNLILLKPASRSGKHQDVLSFAVNAYTIFFLIASFLTSLLSEVSNGDSQAYNLSRVSLALLTKQVFLTSSSTPVQGFHDYAHDYLYLPDLYHGNITSLGLLSFFEFAFVFILTRLAIEHVITTQSLPLIRSPGKVKFIAQLLIISLPAVYYQSTNTKNDLVITPIVISIFLIISIAQSSKLRSSSWLTELCVLLVITNAILLLLSSKGYGVVFVPAIAVALAAVYKSQRSSLREHRSSLRQSSNPVSLQVYTGETKLLATFSLSLFLLNGLTYFTFISNRHHYWSEAYAEFRRIHGPTNLIQIISAAPTTFLRMFLSNLIDLPWPVVIEPCKSFLLECHSDYLAIADKFTIGGIVNEDVAWPSVFFTLSVALVIIFRANIIFASFLRFISLNGSLIDSLLAASISSSFALTALLYWQPYSSRFYICSSVLAVLPLATFLASRPGQDNA